MLRDMFEGSRGFHVCLWLTECSGSFDGHLKPLEVWTEFMIYQELSTVILHTSLSP